MELFRPIALANLHFKIITKILAKRLTPNASEIISPQQCAFIRGYCILDWIIATSGCINFLDQKEYGGNIALKLDIIKAFDTLEWPFLIQTLRAFGFDSKFIGSIQEILKSTRLSILINGAPHGYVECTRG